MPQLTIPCSKTSYWSGSLKNFFKSDQWEPSQKFLFLAQNKDQDVIPIQVYKEFAAWACGTITQFLQDRECQNLALLIKKCLSKEVNTEDLWNEVVRVYSTFPDETIPIPNSEFRRLTPNRPQKGSAEYRTARARYVVCLAGKIVAGKSKKITQDIFYLSLDISREILGSESFTEEQAIGEQHIKKLNELYRAYLQKTRIQRLKKFLLKLFN